MKKFMLSLVAIFFGFAMVVVSAIAIGQESDDASESASTPITASDDSPVELTVDYYLPYPGILPDHPLYVIKMMRDRLRLLLATSVERKFELTLLYADKRIGAAQVLINGGEYDLGARTAVKSQQYLEQASKLASQLEDNAVAEVLAKATATHQNMLTSFLEHTQSGDITLLETALAINKEVQTQLQFVLPETDDVTNEQKTEEASDSATPVQGLEELYPAEFGR